MGWGVCGAAHESRHSVQEPKVFMGKITGLVHLKSREPESEIEIKLEKIPRVLPVEGLE